MDYEKLSLVELKELAKEKGIKNISKIKKEGLILALKELDHENQPVGQGRPSPRYSKNQIFQQRRRIQTYK